MGEGRVLSPLGASLRARKSIRADGPAGRARKLRAVKAYVPPDVEVLSNPTWPLHDTHARQLTQLLLDIWSDYWQIERIDIFDGSDRKDRLALRRKQVQEANTRNTRLALWQPSLDDLTPEVRAWAATLFRAVHDWTTLSLSVEPDDIRIALAAYWWLYDLPHLVPPNLHPDAYERVRRNKLQPLRLKEGDDFMETMKLSRAVLQLTGRPSAELPVWVDPDVTYRSMTMTDCCHAVGIAPVAFRTRLHLFFPEGT